MLLISRVDPLLSGWILFSVGGVVAHVSPYGHFSTPFCFSSPCALSVMPLSCRKDKLRHVHSIALSTVWHVHSSALSVPFVPLHLTDCAPSSDAPQSPCVPAAGADRRRRWRWRGTRGRQTPRRRAGGDVRDWRDGGGRVEAVAALHVHRVPVAQAGAPLWRRHGVHEAAQWRVWRHHHGFVGPRRWVVKAVRTCARYSLRSGCWQKDFLERRGHLIPLLRLYGYC